MEPDKTVQAREVIVAGDMEPEETVQVKEVIVAGDMEPVQVRYGPRRP
jgi:hypothetical protein